MLLSRLYVPESKIVILRTLKLFLCLNTVLNERYLSNVDVEVVMSIFNNNSSNNKQTKEFLIETLSFLIYYFTISAKNDHMSSFEIELNDKTKKIFLSIFSLFEKNLELSPKSIITDKLNIYTAILIYLISFNTNTYNFLKDKKVIHPICKYLNNYVNLFFNKNDYIENNKNSLFKENISKIATIFTLVIEKDKFMREELLIHNTNTLLILMYCYPKDINIEILKFAFYSTLHSNIRKHLIKNQFNNKIIAMLIYRCQASVKNIESYLHSINNLYDNKRKGQSSISFDIKKIAIFDSSNTNNDLFSLLSRFTLEIEVLDYILGIIINFLIDFSGSLNKNLYLQSTTNLLLPLASLSEIFVITEFLIEQNTKIKLQLFDIKEKYIDKWNNIIYYSNFFLIFKAKLENIPISQLNLKFPTKQKKYRLIHSWEDMLKLFDNTNENHIIQAKLVFFINLLYFDDSNFSNDKKEIYSFAFDTCINLLVEDRNYSYLRIELLKLLICLLNSLDNLLFSLNFRNRKIISSGFLLYDFLYGVKEKSKDDNNKESGNEISELPYFSEVPLFCEEDKGIIITNNQKITICSSLFLGSNYTVSFAFYNPISKTNRFHVLFQDISLKGSLIGVDAKRELLGSTTLQGEFIEILNLKKEEYQNQWLSISLVYKLDSKLEYLSYNEIKESRDYSNSIVAYLNGKIIASYENTKHLLSNNILTIGNSFICDMPFGAFANIKIFNKALSQSEISKILFYNNVTSRKTSSCLEYLNNILGKVKCTFTERKLNQHEYSLFLKFFSIFVKNNYTELFLDKEFLDKVNSLFEYKSQSLKREISNFIYYLK